MNLEDLVRNLDYISGAVGIWEKYLNEIWRNLTYFKESLALLVRKWIGWSKNGGRDHPVRK